MFVIFPKDEKMYSSHVLEANDSYLMGVGGNCHIFPIMTVSMTLGLELLLFVKKS